jgi:hypothetical protein
MMSKNLSIATICLLVLLASTVHANVFDVKTYGAKPNADITQVCIGQIGIQIFYITFCLPLYSFLFFITSIGFVKRMERCVCSNRFK